MARMTDGQLLGVLANNSGFTPVERGQAAAELVDRFVKLKASRERLDALLAEATHRNSTFTYHRIMEALEPGSMSIQGDTEK